MTDKHSDETWLLEKVAREEKLGSIVPGGAQGKPRGTTRRSAAERARDRVRLTFQALDDEAA